MQKKNFYPKFLGYFGIFAVILENNHPDQAENAKFGLSDIENLYDNQIYKNAEKKFSAEISM